MKEEILGEILKSMQKYNIDILQIVKDKSTRFIYNDIGIDIYTLTINNIKILSII